MIDETMEKYLTEKEELDRQWHRLLLKHGFKEVRDNDDKSATYQKDEYFISVSFESSPGINRWGSRYDKRKQIWLYGGTSLRSLRDYISGKGDGSMKRSLGDDYDLKTIKKMG